MVRTNYRSTPIKKNHQMFGDIAKLPWTTWNKYTRWTKWEVTGYGITLVTTSQFDASLDHRRRSCVRGGPPIPIRGASPDRGILPGGNTNRIRHVLTLGRSEVSVVFLEQRFVPIQSVMYSSVCRHHLRQSFHTRAIERTSYVVSENIPRSLTPRNSSSAVGIMFPQTDRLPQKGWSWHFSRTVGLSQNVQ